MMTDEPLFMAIRDSDPEFQQTIQDAQATLDEFRRLIRACESSGGMPCLKTRIEDGKERAFLWLSNVRAHAANFVATLFEIPKEFVHHAVGDEMEVSASAVMDWMVNDKGVLYGGYSLRFQRSKLPEAKRAWFDQHIGVTKYV